MFKHLLLDFAKVTERAAIAASRLVGKGDEKLADRQAVDAMRAALNELDIKGRIVIGEGERDAAPMLYIGEEVGTGIGPGLDIAVDPLEGTTILAHGDNNALSVMAVAESGKLLHAPDVYMDKIAIGFNFPERLIDLDNSPAKNLQNIAKAKKCDISELTVMVLGRPRHEELIAKVRETGARIRLIRDGDVAAVIATTMPETEVDVYMGIGGAPEGVLAAAALRATGGQMCGKLLLKSDEQKARAAGMGLTDPSHQYQLEELAAGDVAFIATGVTDGFLLRGIKKNREYITTNSLIIYSKTKEITKVCSRIRF